MTHAALALVELGSLAVAALREQEVVGGLSLLPSVTDSLFYRSREPRPEWVRALEEISPPSNRHGFLKVCWEAGDPWIPGQRWTLYEFLNPDIEVMYKGRWERVLDEETIADLKGPHPRSTGHMCADGVPKQFQCLCRRKLNAWKGGATTRITLRQYQLFQETGYFANPFWIIQGDNGGHPVSYDSMQRKWLQQLGKPTEPPAMGELPYAEPDGRVWAAIRRYNRLAAMGNNIEQFRRTMGEGFGAYKAEIEKEQRRQWCAFLDDSTREEAADFTDAYRKGEMEHLPKTDTDWVKVDELSTHDFIETGVMNSARAYLPTPS